MIRRLAIAAALALTLGACASYPSGYGRDGYSHADGDGYYGGSYYTGNGYSRDGSSSDGYYAAGADGYGDYYYNDPQVILDDRYGYGYGGYGDPFYGFGYGSFPYNGFGVQLGFGPGYYGGYPYGYYNPWYPGYYYGHRRGHDHDCDADDPCTGGARREGGRRGNLDSVSSNLQSPRTGIQAPGARQSASLGGNLGYYGNLPRDRAEYRGPPMTPGVQSTPMRSPPLQPMPRPWQQGYQPPRQPMERLQSHREMREPSSRENATRHNRDTNGNGR